VKRPALDYFGGKWKMASKIIEHFPPHKTFVDVFCGAGSITLKKPQSRNEIINDLNNEVTSFFHVLRDHNAQLKALLEMTPYSRAEYAKCRENSENPIEQARRTVVKAWFGIGDSLDNKTGFRVSLSQSGSTTHPWIKYVDYLPLYAERLRSVIIENLDYRELLKRYDYPDTLFYLDPPYLESTRSKKHAYKFDWELKDHIELLQRLDSLKGNFVLSGYLAPPYDELKFRRVNFLATSQSNARMEYLWIK
jgi:DNA adenine methylase